MNEFLNDFMGFISTGISPSHDKLLSDGDKIKKSEIGNVFEHRHDFHTISEKAIRHTGLVSHLQAA